MSLHVIKKRKTGAASIHQMTSAMELVAATKMRKAQEVALAGRPYAVTAMEILAHMLVTIGTAEELETFLPLEFTRPVPVSAKTAILLIASDKGLAGAFNVGVFATCTRWIKERNLATDDILVIAVGNKAAEYAKKNGYSLFATFSKLSDVSNIEDMSPVATALLAGYRDGAFGTAVCFTTTFVSALEQRAVRHDLLPLTFSHVRETVEAILPTTGKYANIREQVLRGRSNTPLEYIIEPSPHAVIATIAPMLFAIYLYHIMLEANASEHSARRAAMKNATENAGELITTLTLAYNRLRQSTITRELIEITSTASAME